jgi:putative transposase
VLLVTADGQVVENPRHYRKAERQLARAQQRVSRRKQGRKRRRKAVQLLKRHHQRVQRQRRDFHHKSALALLRQYDTIYLEDLQVRTLVRNHHLAKRISDAGWAAFRTILEAKAACAGRPVSAVPPASTTQDCSGVLYRVAPECCSLTAAPADCVRDWGWTILPVYGATPYYSPLSTYGR